MTLSHNKQLKSKLQFWLIKCKQSVKGSIISQILKLPYSNGEHDVNEMEIIQKNTNIICL